VVLLKVIVRITLMCLILFISTCTYINYEQYNKNKYIAWENENLTTFASENPYEIYIDLTEYRLYVFKNKLLIHTFAVAGGKPETPSPFGVWKVVNKGDWGEWFGGHWLGLNIPWGNYGIHGTRVPSSIGRSASHGCIRMFNKDIAKLAYIIPIGTPVVISNGPYSPFGYNPRVILPGDRGSDVLHIQKILKKKGLYKGNIDGIYGDEMKSAIFSLQKQHNIEPHNEIDQETLQILCIFRFE